MKADICVITSTHNPFDTRIFEKECYSITNAGYKIIFFAPIDETKLVDNNILIIGTGFIQKRIHRLKNLALSIDKIFKLNSRIIHVHEPELLLLLPLIKLFKKDVKFIYDVHENYSDAVLSTEKHWIPERLKPVIAGIFDKTEKFLARKSDQVITASPDIEIRFPKCKTISIKNYAPMHLITKAHRLRSKSRSVKISKEIVYTGSLTRTRGILEIVKSLELLDKSLSVKFKVTGWFHDMNFKKEIEDQPAYENLEFLGRLPRYEDMVSRIADADIAMMCFHPDPNLDSAVERSNKLYEYMGLGIPVIVSNIPQWAELIKRHNCGLSVNPLNPEDIADKISFLLTHPDELIQMGINGRKAALKYYNWDSEGMKLVNTYRSLLSDSNG